MKQNLQKNAIENIDNAKLKKYIRDYSLFERDGIQR